MRKFALASLMVMAGAAAQAEGLPGVTDGPGPNLVIEVADAAGTAKGKIVLDLYADKAPKHVERLVALAKSGAYDGVVFHRVIDGFMAQTGDVQFGRADGLQAALDALPAGSREDTVILNGSEIPRQMVGAGMGGSEMGDLKAEFNDVSFQAGTVGMARSNDPDSANSQFFIDLAPADFLDGQYTVVGQLVDGWDVLNAIKKGDKAANGAVDKPDYMAKVTVAE